MVKHLKLPTVKNTLSHLGLKGGNDYWNPEETAVTIRDGYLSEAVIFNEGAQCTSILAGRKWENQYPGLNLLFSLDPPVLSPACKVRALYL